ncbi:MAG: winged helix-turn-helix transcriptional regulator [Candidatus Woesearchaeota archaeon]|nr:MAG: winged helix-turn-helix transcriptional regulator [Candidatus Woesearchaeota archaeon]
MGRGSTQILIRNILESLAKAPKSSSEIVEETGLDRTAISRYLEILKESGFVIEEQQGTSKKFILSSKYRLDTYFGLSLDPETNKLIDSLYHLIQKSWKETTGRKLLKTTAQKIMYQIIETCNLKIPHGWYIYGGVCVKPFDYTKTYDFTGVSDHIVTCVNETVVEYSKNNFEYESKQLQYKKAGKELYDVKEDILKLLYSKNFSKNSMYVFQKLYRTFLFDSPKLNDKVYKELINEYDTLLIDITRYWDDFVDEKNERNFAEFKQKLVSSFEALWKMVAMVNFKFDLSTFYLENELQEHFKFDMNQAKEDVIEIGSELNEMIPFEEPNDPEYKKNKEALQNLNKKTDPTELKKQNEELDKIEREQGLEALNEELFKRAGLK